MTSTTETAQDRDQPTPVASERRQRRDVLANRERVLAGAVRAILRDGPHAPMAAIADQAGVGVGTLYRRYPTREALLAAVTERSFALVLELALEVDVHTERGIVSLGSFLEGTIAHRDQLVLPLHGGPTELSEQGKRLRDDVHAAIERILERGRRDRTVRADLRTGDVVVFGAMLAQPLPNASDWDLIARRQKDIFLAGAARPADPTSEPDQ